MIFRWLRAKRPSLADAALAAIISRASALPFYVPRPDVYRPRWDGPRFRVPSRDSPVSPGARAAERARAIRADWVRAYLRRN